MRFALVGPVAPYRGGISQYNTSLYHELTRDHQVLSVSFSRLYPLLVPVLVGLGGLLFRTVGRLLPRPTWVREDRRAGCKPKRVGPFFGSKWGAFWSRLPLPGVGRCGQLVTIGRQGGRI